MSSREDGFQLGIDTNDLEHNPVKLREPQLITRSGQTQGVPAMQPSQMLMAKRPRLGTELKSVDIQEQTDEHVVLTLSFKHGKDTLTLLREDSSWKIDLALPELRRP